MRIAASAALLAAPIVLAASLSVPALSVPALAATPLTNLSHLDFLITTVTPPAQQNHTTYQLSGDSQIGVLWVYANRNSDGSYQRTGGGSYDSAANTYGQGAYDADDISRAAVVYLRHWRQWHDAHSRDEAYQLLRGLTYLQTASGPDAGNVVLWMQPDGTLNPTPTPPDSPNPSDAGASYWLARTIWALGEGYQTFRDNDPAFAGFLAGRLNLAVQALDRELLIPKYGTYHLVNGIRMPAWLIADGADASSEAMLGLSAYLESARPGVGAARQALRELAAGVAAMAAGNARSWPYEAILPWALSPSDWHGWADEMATGLAAAAGALHDHDLLAPAAGDAAVFLPHLLTATGPDNGWIPAPVDGSQIAYGADSVVRSLLSVGEAAHRDGLRELAGLAAGWFFGQNKAGTAMYDPATGIEFDGVAPDGTVNRNSGAESTIHALLTMEALDANPDLAALAESSRAIVGRDGQHVVEANTATLAGGASLVTPSSVWTGEAQWSASSYVSTPAGSTMTWQLPAVTQPQLVQPVVYLTQGNPARTTFTVGGSVPSGGSVPAGGSVPSGGSAPAGGTIGTVGYAAAGPQGDSAAAGALLPVTLAAPLPAGATQISAVTSAGVGALDSLLLTPLVSTLVLSGNGHGTALLSSVAGSTRVAAVTVPGAGLATIASYDSSGHLITITTSTASTLQVTITPGGFTLITR